MAFPHDVGGVDVAEVLDVADKPVQHWEFQVHAMVALLKPFFNTDQLRRSVEALQPDIYASWSYYGRWAAATTLLLLEKQVISENDVYSALYGDEASTEESFNIGDIVYIKNEDSRIRWRKPHLRTPGYIYGCKGTITAYVGHFHDPYCLAFTTTASNTTPKQALYVVSVRCDDIWHHYDTCNARDDVVTLEIYSNWLSHEPTVSSSQNAASISTSIPAHDHHHDHSHDNGITASTAHMNAAASHDHTHDHDETHSAHHTRHETEANAVMDEPPPGVDQRFATCIIKLLMEKSIISADKLAAVIESIDATNKRLDGAKLIARAWVDEGFKRRLLHNSAEAALELNITTTNPNTFTILRVMECTPNVHHVVVCTLCSCYPYPLLGLSPAWYKSRSYRSRMVRQPRAVLAEFGTVLPKSTAIHVHDSTADCRYLVLPVRPSYTADWSEERLVSIITRDSMLGVRLL